MKSILQEKKHILKESHHFLSVSSIRSVSKKVGECSDITTATWARCTRMYIAFQIYVEKGHVA